MVYIEYEVNNMSAISPKDFAKMMGVSVRTLQRWDKNGQLIAYRRPSGRRFYKKEQSEIYLKLINTETESNNGDLNRVEAGIEEHKQIVIFLLDKYFKKGLTLDAYKKDLIQKEGYEENEAEEVKIRAFNSISIFIESYMINEKNNQKC